MLLKKGMKGEAVKILQRALGIKDDGDYGPKTFNAVKKYQKTKGLIVDGVAGNETLISLGVTIDLSVNEYNANQLIKRIKKLKDYKEIPSDYWIVGVRNPHDSADKFDDMFYL